MMFRPRITSVFASRWKALAWAVSVLVTALGVADMASSGSAGDTAAALAPIAQQPAAAVAAPARSPWAADAPDDSAPVRRTTVVQRAAAAPAPADVTAPAAPTMPIEAPPSVSSADMQAK